MTEHQIKGCQTLAEVEGLNYQPLYYSDDSDTKIMLLNDDLSTVFRDYLHDWNDLLRVAEIIFNHPVKHWCGRQSAKKAFLTHLGEFSKDQAFSVLVEAAEWLKQNKNG